MQNSRLCAGSRGYHHATQPSVMPRDLADRPPAHYDKSHESGHDFVDRGPHSRLFDCGDHVARDAEVNALPRRGLLDHARRQWTWDDATPPPCASAPQGLHDAC